MSSDRVVPGRETLQALRDFVSMTASERCGKRTPECYVRLNACLRDDLARAQEAEPSSAPGASEKLTPFDQEFYSVVPGQLATGKPDAEAALKERAEDAEREARELREEQNSRARANKARVAELEAALARAQEPEGAVRIALEPWEAEEVASVLRYPRSYQDDAHDCDCSVCALRLRVAEMLDPQEPEESVVRRSFEEIIQPGLGPAPDEPSSAPGAAETAPAPEPGECPHFDAALCSVGEGGCSLAARLSGKPSNCFWQPHERASCILRALDASDGKLRERVAELNGELADAKLCWERTQLELVKRQNLKIAELESALASANAAREDAEEKAKGCFRLPSSGKAKTGWRLCLESAADLAEADAQQHNASDLRALAASIERSTEGGEGWWVSAEKVRKVEAHTLSEYQAIVHGVLRILGIPASWLEPAPGGPGDGVSGVSSP